MSPGQHLELEKRIAVEAVTQAARLCQAVRAEMARSNAWESLEKDDRSPVTVADFGSQALICHYVNRVFPRDPIVGEEDSAALQASANASRLAQVTQYVRRFFPQATTEEICHWIDIGKGTIAGRFWTLDPIDGTKGFLRNDQYAIALALIEDGKVQLGVLGCPALPVRLDEPDGPTGVIFVAVRGGGAFAAPLDASIDEAAYVPIHVVQPTQRNEWRFVESVEAAHGNPTLQETVAQAVGFTRPPLRMDSQVKYGAVARGDAALYLRLPSPGQPGYREKIWDHAAGALIVEEAGGCVTDVYGYPLNFAAGYRMKTNRGVVASNGVLHLAVIEALRKQ
ncbi:MAG TPA: 3'(2'),5'-bisphosphate nucleotidase [Chloroflexi bacterium]|nr:3'(2'),5'-bisphosphate nucleotidase [Chloroflexota bacterium]